MPLSDGRRLGSYQILSALGAGGMGEVYRARDTRLDRFVAIKILPEAFAADAERVSRFQREAKVLASLNHPHIAAIYGLEDADGVKALVMELVEGEDLAQRLARGAIPLDEALPIAKQIAEALEAAHEQGIIHRDLKPANIKVRTDGTVKVLDFGLAKAFDPPGSPRPGATTSPTISLQATQAGMILGTAAYMAPEQARGKGVDTRADVWAFGCVLYEVVTGARAFKNDDVTDTIVAILSREPDWQKIPATASAVRPLLVRCLKKDPKQRLQAIGDARIQIEELIGGTSQEAAAIRAPLATKLRPVAALVLSALFGGALVAAVMTWIPRKPAPHARMLPSRFQIVPPSAQSLSVQGADRDLAISPDGQYVVYRGGAGFAQLVVRAIDRLDGHPLTDITNARHPFVSPDSRWIAFFDGTGLKKAPITGGSTITIWKKYAVPRGASWGDDNNIIFATSDTASGLMRVAAGGGEPTVLTTPDAAKGERSHWQPSVLPGSGGVLFTIAGPNQENAQIAVLDLRTGRRKILLRGSQAEYVQSGHLLYIAGGALHAVRFDLERLEVQSDPVAVVDDVLMTSGGAADYAVSSAGTLVYVPGAGQQRPRSLVWLDRHGQEAPIRAPLRVYAGPRLSPDGTRVAVIIRDQGSDVWIWHLAHERLTRLTFDPGVVLRPVWTPDGRRIVFASQRAGESSLFMQSADGTGTAEQLTTGASFSFPAVPAFVAPDGTGIVGSVITPQTNGDVVWFPLKSLVSRSPPLPAPGGSQSAVEPLVRTTAIEYNPEVSPDGRYIAYQSNESGREEIYVRPFPQVNDGRWQVSTGGGTRPVWARNGRELFYLDADNTLTAVSVQTSRATFATTGNPTKLFATTSWTYFERDYDVSPDGQRFLTVKESVAGDRNGTRTAIVVVVNWFEELKAKVPAGK